MRLTGADQNQSWRPRRRATTVLAVRREGEVAMGGDGQITVGEMVIKNSARKIRTLYGGQVLAGFAGGIADAITLFERFEGLLEKHRGHVRHAATELVREWRTDRTLRRLDAWILVAGQRDLLVLSADGDVIEPDQEVVAIGTGSGYAQAAARALSEHSSLSAAEIVRRSLEIAADICIYTNREISVLTLDQTAAAAPQAEEPARVQSRPHRVAARGRRRHTHADE